ncbi:pentapeptide repeat-containing protein [Pelagibacterium halotolerans]|uniref:pentapeptide repeat-containing protein n=1 Tax=Pelagibacterium halotolerans TaxID=531813 RepID=UPI00384A8E37
MIGQAQFEDLIAAGQPVEGSDLSEIDWSDLPAGAIILRDCTLSNARVIDADLSGTQFERCRFTKVGFPGANLTDAVFRDCAFFDAESGEGCDFGRANLEGAIFEGGNLAVSRFPHARLYDAAFRRCKAQGTDFENADFSKSIGGRTAISRVVFEMAILDMVSFRDAKLDDCVFAECSLRQSDFSGSTLASADMRDCDLSEGNFANAVLDNADLRGATVFGLDVTRLVSFEGLKLTPEQLSDVVKPLGIRVFPQ